MIVEQSPRETRKIIRAARQRGQTVGCVPTMGALHPGHVSLIKRARAECDFIVATIFVNPTQFGPNEDLTKYPRTPESDLELCRNAGADLVFSPQTQSMYSPLAQTIVRVSGLASMLEGVHRPGHFDGVSTVVTKLFNITEPDRAYFGQKDYQQQLIIRQMVTDLDQPVEIITCPIIREDDGLALSSRNRFLSADERRRAGQLYQALMLAKQLAAESPLSAAQIASRMADYINSVGGIELQYAIIADANTLELLTERSDPAVALIAAKVGATRLIDNEILLFP